MAGEKTQELAGVAPVGLQRLIRHAAFVAEIAQPTDDFGGDIGGGNKRAHGGQNVTAFFTLP
jgi:hypothetical protein